MQETHWERGSVIHWDPEDPATQCTVPAGYTGLFIGLTYIPAFFSGGSHKTQRVCGVALPTSHLGPGLADTYRSPLTLGSSSFTGGRVCFHEAPGFLWAVGAGVAGLLWVFTCDFILWTRWLGFPETEVNKKSFKQWN